MKRTGLLLLALLAPAGLTAGAEKAETRVQVGVKEFTESAILGEMLASLARQAGADCLVDPPRKSAQVWASLQRGNIDAYVGYTGTLKLFLPDAEDIESELDKLGIRMIPLGFQNNYALGVLDQLAEDRNLRRISDLAREDCKDLTFGFDEEFLFRKDGWNGLKEKYNLPQSPVLVAHAQAYRDLGEGTIHVTDCYTTDGELSQEKPKVRLLEDDQNFFPTYKAVLLVRTRDVPENVLEAWSKLEGRISQSAMQQMNAAVSVEKQEHEVAAEFLREQLNLPDPTEEPEEAPGPTAANRSKERIWIGAKDFTESRILAEMAAYLIRRAGGRCTILDLGGSEVVWEALKKGEIQVYPGYTGTLREELLYGTRNLEPVLKRYGIRASKPLGFRNDYGLGMLEAKARERNITTISDLLKKENRDLKFGFTPEFLSRKDGWPGLLEKYPFTQKPIAIEHDRAYEALAAGEIDVMEVYTTDGDLRHYQMKVLEDDRDYFGVYEAIFLYRPDSVPSWFQTEVLDKLEGKIDEQAMREMNYQVEYEHLSERKVAADFLNPEGSGALATLFRQTWEHFLLVLISLLAAVLLGLPLGILAANWDRSRRVVPGAVGVLQALCALVILAFVLPFLEIMPTWAVAALFLYALLPVVLGTYTGLTGIPRSIRETVVTMGLPSRTGLFLVEIPVASRSILAGMKTSALICVAVGLLGHFLGAGGYGEALFEGIRARNVTTILQGALPAALMALALLGLFALLERVVLPRGLRLQSA